MVRKNKVKIEKENKIDFKMKEKLDKRKIDVKFIKKKIGKKGVNEFQKASKKEIESAKLKVDKAKKEISKIVVGQESIIEGFFRAILLKGT